MLAWSFGRPDENEIWFDLYTAIISGGLFFAGAFVIEFAWHWANTRRLFVKAPTLLGVGLVVGAVVFGVIVVPLAEAFFDKCLVPTVEYQGACRFKP